MILMLLSSFFASVEVFASSLSHIARTAPPALAAKELTLFDNLVRQSFTECLALDPYDSSLEQAQLSHSHGGPWLMITGSSLSSSIYSLSQQFRLFPSITYTCSMHWMLTIKVLFKCLRVFSLTRQAVNLYQHHIPPHGSLWCHPLVNACTLTLKSAIQLSNSGLDGGLA